MFYFFLSISFFFCFKPLFFLHTSIFSPFFSWENETDTNLSPTPGASADAPDAPSATPMVAYDQTILTTRPVGANRPDILIKDLGNRKTYIIDISCPIDTNVSKKESEKIAKYGALRVEAERMWGGKAEVIPVVVGGLGAVSKNLRTHLARIPGSPDLHMCQKICLLGSKKILQDALTRH